MVIGSTSSDCTKNNSFQLKWNSGKRVIFISNFSSVQSLKLFKWSFVGKKLWEHFWWWERVHLKIASSKLFMRYVFNHLHYEILSQSFAFLRLYSRFATRTKTQWMKLNDVDSCNFSFSLFRFWVNWKQYSSSAKSSFIVYVNKCIEQVKSAHFFKCKTGKYVHHRKKRNNTKTRTGKMK